MQQEAEEPTDNQTKFSLKSSFRKPRHKLPKEAAAPAAPSEGPNPEYDPHAPLVPPVLTKPLVSIYSHRFVRNLSL